MLNFPESGLVVLELFFYVCRCTCIFSTLFRNISVWKKALAQHLNKFEFSIFKDAKFGSTLPSVSGKEEDSKILSVKFPNFYIISL